MREPLTARFMRAFRKSIWGEVTDRRVDLILFVVGVIVIGAHSRLSWEKFVAGTRETLAIAVTVICLLVIYHSFRSAYAVALEIGEEGRSYGFKLGPQRISSPKIKLYGIAVCLTVLAVMASVWMWERSFAATDSNDSTLTIAIRPPRDHYPVVFVVTNGSSELDSVDFICIADEITPLIKI